MIPGDKGRPNKKHKSSAKVRQNPLSLMQISLIFTQTHMGVLNFL